MKTEPKGFWGRLPVANGPPKTKPKLRLEFAFEIQLEAAAGVGRGGETNIWAPAPPERDKDSEIKVFCKITSRGQYRAGFFFFLVMGNAADRHVKIQKKRPLQRRWR